MRPLLRQRGHELVTPTYTGLGERSHLAGPAIDLETHIRDVLNVLTYENLRDVVLVGHSYGGMVATGVADRARDRLAGLVYLDAFVPNDGQSLVDLLPPETRERMLAGAAANPEGWKVPPNPTPPDTAPADAVWLDAHKTFQPLATMTTPVRLSAPLNLPRAYIHCTRKPGGDSFRQFAECLRDAPGWRFHEMDESHNPHITAPDELAGLLDRIVREFSDNV
jgi:pimeloyl-ACP methyl ester carboxylesterase